MRFCLNATSPIPRCGSPNSRSAAIARAKLSDASRTRPPASSMNPRSDSAPASSGATRTARAASASAPCVSPLPNRRRARLTSARTSSGSISSARSTSRRASVQIEARLRHFRCGDQRAHRIGMTGSRAFDGLTGRVDAIERQLQRREQQQRTQRLRVERQRRARFHAGPERHHLASARWPPLPRAARRSRHLRLAWRIRLRRAAAATSARACCTG